MIKLRQRSKDKLQISLFANSSFALLLLWNIISDYHFNWLKFEADDAAVAKTKSTVAVVVVNSVIRWLHFVFSFGHLQQWKFTQDVAKVDSKFCPKLNRPFRICQKYIKFLPKWRNIAKSGHTGRQLQMCWSMKYFSTSDIGLKCETDQNGVLCLQIIYCATSFVLWNSLQTNFEMSKFADLM